MSHLVLHDVDPRVIEMLGERGQRHGRSAEDEARALLEGALGLSRAGALAGAHRLRQSWEGRRLAPNGDLLRAGADGVAGAEGAAGAAVADVAGAAGDTDDAGAAAIARPLPPAERA